MTRRQQIEKIRKTAPICHPPIYCSMCWTKWGMRVGKRQQQPGMPAHALWQCVKCGHYWMQLLGWCEPDL